MDTNEHEEGTLLHKELVYSLVGCALEVLNVVGHGLHEKPYENGLVVEFGLKGISFEQQRRFAVLYKGVQIGEFIPDLIAGNAVVVDTKVIDRITDVDAWPDVELPAYQQIPCRPHPQFQETKTRMGADRALISIRVH